MTFAKARPLAVVWAGGPLEIDMHFITRLCLSAVLVSVLLQLPAVRADEICVDKVVLQPGETWTHVFKLTKGSYTYRTTPICGSGDQLRVEAELLGGTSSAKSTDRGSTNDVAFQVAQNCDTWKVTCTNTSTNETLSFIARFTNALRTPRRPPPCTPLCPPWGAGSYLPCGAWGTVGW